jgi:hypothetical protein
MANRKISQFADLAGAQTPTMEIPVRDPAAGSTDAGNRKSTLNDLFADLALNTTDKGVSMTGVATASAPAVSAASKVKFYYDTTLNKWMLSRNGAAYQELLSGSPSFPLSVSNSTGQITSSTSDTGAAVSNPGLVVTRGDGKRTAQLTVSTTEAGQPSQLNLAAEIVAVDPVCKIAFNKTASGGGPPPSTANLGALSFRANGTESGGFYVMSLGSFGSTMCYYTIPSGGVAQRGIYAVDNWGTFRVSRNLGNLFSDVQLSDPSKLMVIGNVDNTNDTTKVCLHVLNATGFTDQTNFLLQAVSGQTSNLFECKTSTNIKTLQITSGGVLSPGVAAGVDLATAALPFKDFYLAGSSGTPASNNFRLTGTATGARVVTLPDASIVVAGSASALTSGRVPFVTTGGVLADDTNLQWNGTFLRLYEAEHSFATHSAIQIVTGKSLQVASYESNIWNPGVNFGASGLPYAGAYGVTLSYLAKTVSGVWKNSGGGIPIAVSLAEGYFGFVVGGSGVTDDTISWTAKFILDTNGRAIINGSSALGQLSVTSYAASTIGQVIRGAASQTADLFQLQSNAGTVLSAFDSSGRFYAPTALTSTTATAGAQTLPSNPDGFVLINVNGTQKKVPYYND